MYACAAPACFRTIARSRRFQIHFELAEELDDNALDDQLARRICQSIFASSDLVHQLREQPNEVEDRSCGDRCMRPKVTTVIEITESQLPHVAIIFEWTTTNP